MPTRKQELERENAELRELIQWMYHNWGYSIHGYYKGLLREAEHRMEELGCKIGDDAE